jgi:hypothetical protein
MSHLYGLDRHCYHPAVTSAYLAANWGGQDEAVRDMNDLKPNVLWEQMLFASAAVRTASFREVELPGYDVLQFAELPKFRAVDALRGFDKVLESQDVKKRDDTVSEPAKCIKYRLLMLRSL